MGLIARIMVVVLVTALAGLGIAWATVAGPSRSVASTAHHNPVAASGQAVPMDGAGYREVAADGGVFTFGDAHFYGSMGGTHLNSPVVGVAATPDGAGYWEVAADGGVFTFGDAHFYGSMGGTHLNSPVVGVAATPDGAGYWEVAADGGVFTFGDAHFYGSMGGTHLNSPVVGVAATPDGAGYWEVAADGGVFTFGDAHFYGSMGGTHLNSPVVGVAATPDGAGYWEVAADGGVFTFGDAHFYGSMGGTHLNSPVVGVAATPDGAGYWEVAADGGVFTFGDAHFYGSMGGTHLNSPVVGVAGYPSASSSSSTSTTSTTSPGSPTSTTGSHAVATYTHASGFPKTNELANSSPQTTITQSMTTGAVGDLVIALVHNGVYAPLSTIAYATGVTDTAGAITWQPAASVRSQDTKYPDIPAGQAYEIWYGVVKTAGKATTVTATFGTPVTDLFLYLDQWASSNGSSATWTFTGSSVAVDTNAATVDFPSLTSGGNGGIYWGYAYGSIHDTSMTAGSTSGFTYYKTPTFGNMITYNGALAASTTYAPTCTQAFSGGTGWYDTIGAVFADDS